MNNDRAAARKVCGFCKCEEPLKPFTDRGRKTELCAGCWEDWDQIAIRGDHKRLDDLFRLYAAGCGGQP